MHTMHSILHVLLGVKSQHEDTITQVKPRFVQIELSHMLQEVDWRIGTWSRGDHCQGEILSLNGMNW